MPNKAQDRRRQKEEAEIQRRRAQSQRDKARNRREEIDRLARAVQRQLALDRKPTPPAAKPERNSSTISLASIMEARSNKLMQDIARMFNDTKYSDATVHIHDVKLPVHKSVICIQSAYFEKAFQDVFIEGSSGVLTFNDGSGAAYWRVFEYLYTGDYSDDPPNDFGDDPALLKDPRVYALADMFFLEDLKVLCAAKLQQKLQDLWTTDSFPECVREIYASTPNSDRTIRPVVVKVAKIHVHELGNKAIFKDLIREGGDFAVDYFEMLTELDAFTYG